MWDEGIPLVLSEKQFKLIKGMETFLIRDGGECVIWVLTLEIENELSVGVVCAIVLDALLQSFPADDSREMAMRLSVNGSSNSTFKVGGPAFVQPEVLPARCTDKVTGPRMRQLVCDDVDVLLVTRYDGRSSVGPDWVLHAAVRE